MVILRKFCVANKKARIRILVGGGAIGMSLVYSETTMNIAYKQIGMRMSNVACDRKFIQMILLIGNDRRLHLMESLQLWKWFLKDMIIHLVRMPYVHVMTVVVT